MIGKLIALVVVVVGTGVVGGSLVRAQGTCDPPNQYCATGDIEAHRIEAFAMEPPGEDDWIVELVTDYPSPVVTAGLHRVAVAYETDSGRTLPSEQKEVQIPTGGVIYIRKLPVPQLPSGATGRWVFITKANSSTLWEATFINDMTTIDYTFNDTDSALVVSVDPINASEHGTFAGTKLEGFSNTDFDRSGESWSTTGDYTTASDPLVTVDRALAPRAVAMQEDQLPCPDDTVGAQRTQVTVAKEYGSVNITTQNDPDGCDLLIENGGADGQIMVISTSISGDILVKTSASTKLAGAADFSLTQYDTIMLIRKGFWLEVSRSAN